MRLVLTADDTTGALETAAGCADAGWTVDVVPHAALSTGAAPAAPMTVVDLRSRHATAEEAAARVRHVLGTTSPRAHKIDSTLRGNWPAEVAALRGAGRVVVIVPAYPAAGRVCVDGIVSEHGVPVDRSAHAGDPRSPVRTARPASLLPGAIELDDADRLARWLRTAAAGDAAVVDAVDDAAVEAAVAVLAEWPDVVLVGTARVLAALVARDAPAHRVAASGPGIALERPVLVVAGSAHPVSRAQVVQVRHAAMPSVHVLAAPVERRDDPAAVVATLAAEARRSVGALGIATVVVLGGDTAEALIGDQVVHVHGSLGVGIARGTVTIGGHEVTLVSKPGAFGDADTVAALLGIGSGTADSTTGDT